MSDSISRSAAIHAVCSFAILRYKASPEDLDAIGAVLNALPSAQPERKTGEWREHIFDGIMGRRPRALMCTNCNVISIYASNFCPNCGADMRGEDDE